MLRLLLPTLLSILPCFSPPLPLTTTHTSHSSPTTPPPVPPSRPPPTLHIYLLIYFSLEYDVIPCFGLGSAGSCRDFFQESTCEERMQTSGETRLKQAEILNLPPLKGNITSPDRGILGLRPLGLVHMYVGILNNILFSASSLKKNCPYASMVVQNNLVHIQPYIQAVR